MEHNHLYILQEKKAVPCPNVMEWGKGFETANRIVKQESIEGGIEISTVFIGIDHGLAGFPGYKPLLFETMVFGGEMDGFCERYSTWIGAEYGHQKIVEKIQQANK